MFIFSRFVETRERQSQLELDQAVDEDSDDEEDDDYDWYNAQMSSFSTEEVDGWMNASFGSGGADGGDSNGGGGKKNKSNLPPPTSSVVRRERSTSYSLGPGHQAEIVQGRVNLRIAHGVRKMKKALLDRLARQNINELFCDLDVDGDGQIDRKELSNALGKMGIPCVKEDFEVIFKEVDVDGSGKIDLEELSSAMAVWKLESDSDCSSSSSSSSDDDDDDDGGGMMGYAVASIKE